MGRVEPAYIKNFCFAQKSRAQNFFSREFQTQEFYSKKFWAPTFSCWKFSTFFIQLLDTPIATIIRLQLTCVLNFYIQGETWPTCKSTCRTINRVNSTWRIRPYESNPRKPFNPCEYDIIHPLWRHWFHGSEKIRSKFEFTCIAGGKIKRSFCNFR